MRAGPGRAELGWGGSGLGGLPGDKAQRGWRKGGAGPEARRAAASPPYPHRPRSRRDKGPETLTPPCKRPLQATSPGRLLQAGCPSIPLSPCPSVSPYPCPLSPSFPVRSLLALFLSPCFPGPPSPCPVFVPPTHPPPQSLSLCSPLSLWIGSSCPPPPSISAPPFLPLLSCCHPPGSPFPHLSHLVSLCPVFVPRSLMSSGSPPHLVSPSPLSSFSPPSLQSLHPPPPSQAPPGAQPAWVPLKGGMQACECGWWEYRGDRGLQMHTSILPLQGTHPGSDFRGSLQGALLNRLVSIVPSRQPPRDGDPEIGDKVRTCPPQSL